MKKDELKWYVLELNTSDSFSIYYKRVSSIIPKGCAVMAISKVKYHDYFASKVDRTVLLTNYIFILCNLEKHIKAIIQALKHLGIEASLLDGLDGKPLEVSSYDIAQMKQSEEPKASAEEQDYKPGEYISVVSGPMRGFTGNISLVTSKYLFCSLRVGKAVTNVPFLRQDVIRLKLK